MDDTTNADFTGELAVMGPSGHESVQWNSASGTGVATAEEQFEKLKERQYTPFRMEGKSSSKGEQITTFDPTAERIVMVPRMQGGAW